MGVYKEGKNWKVQVYYKDWQGNQKRKQKRGFRTKGEAKVVGARLSSATEPGCRYRIRELSGNLL